MFAAIHNSLKVIAADIGNAYLHAKTNEKLYTILGDDYGELSRKVLVFNKGLYGLRSSGARFHEHLSDILRKTGFIPPRLTQTYGSKTVEPIMNTWQDMLMTSWSFPRLL